MTSTYHMYSGKRQKKVNILPPRAEEDEDPAGILDQTESWRLEQLLLAGYEDIQATAIALRRDIDLHEACDLAEEAGPRQAFEILY